MTTAVAPPSLCPSVIVTVEDLERNDGSPEKPYFMSKNLMKILNKSNKVPKKGKGKNWGANTVTVLVLTSQHF